MNTLPQLLTAVQICESLGISRTGLWRLEKDRSFPRVELNPRVIRYAAPDVMHWIEGKKKGGWLGLLIVAVLCGAGIAHADSSSIMCQRDSQSVWHCFISDLG